MEKIKIYGGHELNGSIDISGAKNAVLPLMTAALLTDQPVTLKHVPNLRDVRTLRKVIDHLGTKTDFDNGTLTLHAQDLTSDTAPYEMVREMRASILVLGPLLARNGTAQVSLPGGCAIGTRPVDLHLDGLREMGAEIELEDGYIVAKAPKGLKGAHILFPKVSVGATENLMMAASLAEGTTVLANAAREPEITDLGECLISMGAEIEGLGTDKITIHGKKTLSGTTHTVVPDRIETGTFVIAAAMAGGTLTLNHARADHIEALIDVLYKAGVDVTETENGLQAKRARENILGVDVMTEPYPGFPTDLQAQMMSMLTIAEGAGMVTETIFENRFMHVPELKRMGADITVHASSALVRGVKQLKGADVMATDLRASVSLVLAGLVAKGATTVHRIYHLDRGYENIVEKLSGVGAKLERLHDESAP